MAFDVEIALLGPGDEDLLVGVGKRLLDALLDHGRALGCAEAWVLTDRGNRPAARLYESAGGLEVGEETLMYTFDLAGEPR